MKYIIPLLVLASFTACGKGSDNSAPAATDTPVQERPDPEQPEPAIEFRKSFVVRVINYPAYRVFPVPGKCLSWVHFPVRIDGILKSTQLNVDREAGTVTRDFEFGVDTEVPLDEMKAEVEAYLKSAADPTCDAQMLAGEKVSLEPYEVDTASISMALPKDVQVFTKPEYFSEPGAFRMQVDLSDPASSESVNKIMSGRFTALLTYDVLGEKHWNTSVHARASRDFEIPEDRDDPLGCYRANYHRQAQKFQDLLGQQPLPVFKGCAN